VIYNKDAHIGLYKKRIISFIHSFSHSLTHSLTHSFIHSLPWRIRMIRLHCPAWRH